jgi:hypothetical protein
MLNDEGKRGFVYKSPEPIRNGKSGSWPSCTGILSGNPKTVHEITMLMKNQKRYSWKRVVQG